MGGLLTYMAIGAVEGGAKAAGRGWREQAKEARDQAFQKKFREEGWEHQAEQGEKKAQEAYSLKVQEGIQKSIDREEDYKYGKLLADYEDNLTRNRAGKGLLLGKNEEGELVVTAPDETGKLPYDPVATLSQTTRPDGSISYDIEYKNKRGLSTEDEEKLREKIRTQADKAASAQIKKELEDLDNSGILMGPNQLNTKRMAIWNKYQKYFNAHQKRLSRAYLGGGTIGSQNPYDLNDNNAFASAITTDDATAAPGGDKTPAKPEAKKPIPLAKIKDPKARAAAERIRAGEILSNKELAAVIDQLPPSDMLAARKALSKRNAGTTIHTPTGETHPSWLTPEAKEKVRIDSLVEDYMAGKDLSLQDYKDIQNHVPEAQKDNVRWLIESRSAQIPANPPTVG